MHPHVVVECAMEVHEKSSWRQGKMVTKGPEVVHTAENDLGRREAAVLTFTEQFSASSDGVGTIRTARLEICQRCHVFCSTWAAALKVIQDDSGDLLH